MKKIIPVFALALCIAACSTSGKKEETAQEAKTAVLDSIETANRAQAIQQRTIDSMNQVAAKEQEARAEHHHASTGTTSHEATATEQKKGMNNTKKGALIGAGAGAVTGAVTGAAVSGEKGKGAIIGGLIGAAAGAGVGAVTGKTIDKKKEKEAEQK